MIRLGFQKGLCVYFAWLMTKMLQAKKNSSNKLLSQIFICVTIEYLVVALETRNLKTRFLHVNENVDILLIEPKKQCK